MPPTAFSFFERHQSRVVPFYSDYSRGSRINNMFDNIAKFIGRDSSLERTNQTQVLSASDFD